MEIYIDGQKINYINKGTGKNVLLLHGWGVNIDLYKNLINEIAKSNNVYALDLPGFGKSDEPNEIWNVDKYVDLVQKFIEKLDLKEINLIGHSFGGRIIIKLANKNSLEFKINKIVLLGSAGIKHKLKFNKKVKVRIYKICKKIINCKVIQKRFPNFMDKVKSKFGSDDYKKASNIMRGSLVQVVNEDLTNLIPNIKSDTLLIWGTCDEATPIEDGRKMKELIKNSKLLEIEGATHYAFLESPLLVNQMISEFLK